MMTKSNQTKPRDERQKLLQVLLFGGAFLFSALTILQAGSATWRSDAPSTTWSDPANWTPATVPNSPTDVATFAVSSQTHPVPSEIDLGAMIFNPGASSYFMYPGTVDYYGAGVVNNSSFTQEFYVEASNITFHNSASAGDSAHYSVLLQSEVRFFDGSTAGSAAIDLFYDGGAYFADQSTAGNATFNCTSGVNFQPGSSGGAAVFNLSGEDVSGGGHGAVLFYGGDAAAASFAAGGGKVTGGSVSFLGASSGGTCNVTVSSRQGHPTGDLRDGHLDISSHNAPGLSIGSLAGDGLVLLGTNTLTIGTNNLSAIFSGLIQGEGSLVKVGSGKLTLMGANTYSGGTLLSSGTLLANNSSGSATGSGSVEVKGGILSGGGTIGGSVKIGGGHGSTPVLGPGERGTVPGTLTILGRLNLFSNATCFILFNSDVPSADQIIANGVAIRGAQIQFGDNGNGVLPPGSVFTIINNTGAAIKGAFSNLPDETTITIGNNTFQANYEGGDGNDLTLTVVP